jgi:hypothetical protein
MCDKRKNLFDEVFTNSWWSEQNNFPPCDEWKADIEEHLRFMLNKNYLPLIENQLKSRNFEAFLSEIFAAYFVEKNLGFKVTEWNPRTKNGRNVEFRVKIEENNEIFCEVKNPGWQGQLTKEEIDSGRAKLGKRSKFTESRAVAPYMNIRKTIEKSYGKFLPDRQNLLIITDNLFQPLSMGPKFNPELERKIPFDIYLALYNCHDEIYHGKGYFRTDRFKNLSGILFLNDRDLRKFFAWIENNPNAKVQLSKEFVTEALKLNEQCIKLAERDYIKHNGTD